MREPDGKVRKRRVAYNEPGHAHELTFSCHNRLSLLSKDRTRQWFVLALEAARQRWHFDLWAYVIMPEHAHVLLLPRNVDYQVGMILKAIKQPVGRKTVAYLRESAPHWLPRLEVVRRSGRTDYRFWRQGGGYDRNSHKAETAWLAVDYIHNNPVRRGLAPHPMDWEWSSARWYEGEENVPIEMDDRPPDPPQR